jgi:hypothetical protein
MTMLRGSAKRQEQILATIGATVVLCIAVVTLAVVVNPFGGRAANQFSITVDTPFVGQGVEAGTAIVLHGVKVGHVTGITGTMAGGVRFAADLNKRAVSGLTDAVNIDYRPINYFGVAGINLLPGPGGKALRDGSELSLVPKGNFTLSELLSQLGDVSQASMTPQLIQVIDRVTRYTDGLTPFFETAVTVTRAVADEQTVPTSRLLANTSSIAKALPDFTDETIESLTRMTHWTYYPHQSFPPADTIGTKLQYPYFEGMPVPNLADEPEDYYKKSYLAFMKLAGEGLFASVGKLETSHVDDLYPLIAGITALTDATPPLLRPQDIAAKLAELRSRFEKLYAGDGTQRAVSVRVVLDSLPGVAAPIGVSVGGGR